jgi:hypothetical protein
MVYDITHDIKYDIGYDIGISNIQYYIIYNIGYDIGISVYNLPRMLHESKCLVAKVLALATEAPRKPCRTPLGSYHHNQASFEESVHRFQAWQ